MGGRRGVVGKKERDDESEFWDDYEEWREGPVEDTEDKSDYGDGYKWSCCEAGGNERRCVRGPHEGKEYLELTSMSMTVRDIEGLPEAKHQRVGEPERKFSNSVADLVETVAVEPAKPVEAPKSVEPSKPAVESKVQVPSKAPAVITVSDSSDREEEEIENLET